MSKPAASAEIPTRGIWRKASVSRKLARQQAFRLLTIPLDEEEDDSDDDEGNSDLAQKIASNETDKSFLDWEMDLLHSSQVDTDDEDENDNANRWMKQLDSLRRSITSSTRAEIPIREIVIDGDYDEKNFSPSMEIRRKKDAIDGVMASALGIDPQLSQLLCQVKRAEQNGSNQVEKSNNGNRKDNRRLRDEGKTSDRLKKLRGSLINMCEAIRTGLNDEIIADSASSSSRSVSLDSTGNLDNEEIKSFNVDPDSFGDQEDSSESVNSSNDLFTLHSELGLQDDNSTAESLNSFALIHGCNDSVALALEKKAMSQATRRERICDSTFTASTVASSVFSSLRSSALTSFSFASFSDDIAGTLNNISGDAVGEGYQQQQHQQHHEKPLSSIRFSHRSGKRRSHFASCA